MSSEGKPYVVVGCKATGETHPRLEIRELIKNPYQFSLFVRALEQLQDANYTPKPASFREIGGIHGLPYQVYSGDPKEQPVDGDDSQQWLGYCYHATVLFPTWHRALMMLIEQAVSEAASATAVEDERVAAPEEKGKWAQAAKQLRFPFWDWTNPDTGKEGLPIVNGRSIFGDKIVPILDPASAKYVDRANPLYTFSFGDQLPDGFTDSPPSYFGEWSRTYRWPTDDKVNPTEQYNLLDQTLTSADAQAPYTWLSNKVKLLFSVAPQLPANDGPSVWDRFSNTSPQEQSFGTSLGPIEEPHNQIHNNVGGNGHMADPDYAGFDPMFYMHHCNVDRILAFWEAVYPDYWMGNGWFDNDGNVTPFVGTSGTLVMPEGQSIGEDTDLAPFRKTDSSYWTSKEVRFLNKDAPVIKYYTYEPINGVSLDNPLTPEQRVQAIYTLQSYFSPNSKAHALPFEKLPPLFSTPGEDGMKGIPDSASPVEKFRHFIIEGSLDPNAFNGSYNLQIVLAHALGNLAAGTVVDTISVFARKDPSRCANCANRQAREAKFSAIAIIPRDIIVALIRDHRLDRSDKEGDEADAEFLGHLTGAFVARIVKPDGTLLAERPLLGEGAEQEPDGAWWPKLTLLSAAASTPKEIDSATPTDQFFLHDWKNHGDLLGDGWQKA